MIGNNFIGRMGRYCNQMSQYAALKGIASNMGYDYCIPLNADPVDDGIGNMQYNELFDSFDLSHVKIGIIEPSYMSNDSPLQRQAREMNMYITETKHSFNEDIFNDCPDNVTLKGYFQTENYFKHIEDEVREDFTFNPGILLPCQEMISTMDSPIAIHIRRTDYIMNQANHHNLSLKYYETALKEFDSDRNVIVFSDDPTWCKEQDLFQDDRFIVSENTDNRIDLCLMSLCSDFIIANSSFSWWGAWLSANKDKKVIAPTEWFGTTGYTKNHDTSDVVPDEWVRISDG